MEELHPHSGGTIVHSTNLLFMETWQEYTVAKLEVLFTVLQGLSEHVEGAAMLQIKMGTFLALDCKTNHRLP